MSVLYKKNSNRGVIVSVITLILILNVLALNYTITAMETEFADELPDSLTNNLEQYEMEADRLKEIGLFEGTSAGYELEAYATRVQGAVMLVRYMGVEEQAIEAYDNKMISHPFNDVPDWANPHIAYLYTEGLTNGMTEITYGSTKDLTANQYITMLLRMLGYDDSVGEFLWNDSSSFFISQFNSGELVKDNALEFATSTIPRGVMVNLSEAFLSLTFKETDTIVFDKLYHNEAIGEDIYIKYHDYYVSQGNNASQTGDDTDGISGDAKETDNTNIDNMDSDKSGLPEEIRGVWLSYLDLKPMLLNQNKSSFENNINEAMDNLVESGFNTVYLQVRPFADAIYPSEIYPWSSILTGTEGVDPGYDPLDVCIEVAKKHDLRIEVWINPYRVRNNVTTLPIDENSTVGKMIADNERIVMYSGNTVTFNPYYSESRELINQGVVELVNNYEIDGIHFDDYFYPSDDYTLDDVEYALYLEKGGNLSQKEFRYEQVNLLIEMISNTLSAYENITFSISPQGSMDNNRDLVFVDVDAIVENEWIDYIVPQVYFGFENETSPFISTVEEWHELVDGTGVKLVVGLSAYKIGLSDRWAGTGSREWINNQDLLKRMVIFIREENDLGFVVFRYGSLFEPLTTVEESVLKELVNLKDIMK